MKFTTGFLLLVFIVFSFVACNGTQTAAPAVDSEPIKVNKAEKESPPTQAFSPNPSANKADKSSTVNEIDDLKSWIGKYPIGENRQKDNFFELPQVKPTLLKMLGKKGYQDFLDGFELVEPIESFQKTETIGKKKVDFDYLILKGNYAGKSVSNKNAPEHTLFVIELNFKEFYILSVKDDKLTERGNVDEFILPEEIEKKITIYLPEN